ncbi:MAG TPA: DUF2461 domain-containing protein [Conexibacter sp.]|nr:DUF2461 domain-containing protein [Conexibacter sp.]
MTGFRGFPPGALDFLRELEDNNDRDWFKANRRRYDELLVAPARALGEELEAAGFGRPHLFRPWNDTRFTRTPPTPPIKEQLGLAGGYEDAGGFYVELSLDGLFVAAGLHNPAPDQVERLRRLVADGRSAAVLTRAIAVAEAAALRLNEPDLVRAPRGYSADHPRIELLRHRALTVSQRHTLASWIHRPAADRRIRAQLDAAAPLVRWLRERVGPSERPRTRR